MVKSFHGGIKKQKRLFVSSPLEGDVKVTKGCCFAYKVPNGGICVAHNEDVYVGSVLACVEGLSPTLSGVSGKVAKIEDNEITVIADGEQKVLPSLPPFEKALSEISAEEVAVRLADCAVASRYTPDGIFPVCKAAQELSEEKRIKLIIDCSSPTVASSANQYLIKKYPREISGGIRILMRACGASEAHLVCDDSSFDIVNILESICDEKYVKLSVAEARYPMQNEKLLIYLALNKEISRKRSAVDYGIVCADCEAAVNAYRAAALGERAVARMISIQRKDNVECVLAPVGLPLSELVGGVSHFSIGELSENMLSGDDASGLYVDGTWDVIVFCDSSRQPIASPCIGCGKCDAVCPMYLPVSRIVPPTLEKNGSIYERYGFAACIGCGCCSAVCPSGIEIRKYIEGGKSENEQ